jgi:hypothetical protein
VPPGNFDVSPGSCDRELRPGVSKFPKANAEGSLAVQAHKVYVLPDAQASADGGGGGGGKNPGEGTPESPLPVFLSLLSVAADGVGYRNRSRC